MIAALPFFFIYAGLTLTLGWHDLKARLLPDRLTCPLLWSGQLFYLCLFPELLPLSVLGAIVGYLAFAAIYWGYRWLRKQEGLGYGDVKFLAALGAWHGWQQLPQLVCIAASLALLFICIQAIDDLSLRPIKNPLPFGPFLAAAGWICSWQTVLSLPL
ncbi:A24 family peptidase [Trabulsiella odontotermitis]|uniref:prepilin peptidase n=1 Tax=Trabulsiella odontotermitis TaxID=379893 RepID=UPI0024B78D89|nr:A24 family peptidase [Trabulsiella odontotermitis]WHP31677.1 A24 family peptidase [Trabulsiella odontotermitis]